MVEVGDGLSPLEARQIGDRVFGAENVRCTRLYKLNNLFYYDDDEIKEEPDET
jgi:hypothetical protein